MAFCDVPGDEPVGDGVEIVADDLRLRADRQHIVPDATNEGAFPSGRDGTERVPGMASDQAKLCGLHTQLRLDIGVGLTRGLMALHAIRAGVPVGQLFGEQTTDDTVRVSRAAGRSKSFEDPDTYSFELLTPKGRLMGSYRGGGLLQGIKRA